MIKGLPYTALQQIIKRDRIMNVLTAPRTATSPAWAAAGLWHAVTLYAERAAQWLAARAAPDHVANLLELARQCENTQPGYASDLRAAAYRGPENAMRSVSAGNAARRW